MRGRADLRLLEWPLYSCVEITKGLIMNSSHNCYVLFFQVKYFCNYFRHWLYIGHCIINKYLTLFSASVFTWPFYYYIVASLGRSIFTTSLKFLIFYHEGVYLLWNLTPNTLSEELLHSGAVLGSFKYLPYKLAKSRNRLTILMFLNYDRWRGMYGYQ